MSTLKRRAGVFKFLWFEKRFRKARFSWQISVDGRPNRRNKAAFSNFSGVVWTPLTNEAKGKLATGNWENVKYSGYSQMTSSRIENLLNLFSFPESAILLISSKTLRLLGKIARWASIAAVTLSTHVQKPSLNLNACTQHVSRAWRLDF